MHSFVFYLLVIVFDWSVSQRVYPKSPEPVFLRLKPFKEASPLPHQAGFLELFYRGSWFRVCNEDWGDTETSVACGNLGFPDFAPVTPAQESYRANWDILIRTMDVQCDGTESKLSECDSVAVTFNRLCYSGEAVILNCQRKAAESIRLRAGALVGEGRVQVANEKHWGGVCSNLWNIKSANVACRQLGFGTAKQTFTNAEFGRSHTLVWYTNVTCNGDEKKLTDCSYEHPEVSNYLNYTSPGCSIRQQASLVCHTPDTGERKINLTDGEDFTVGRVTVRVNNKWGSICSDNWRINEAMVVCRQLGFGYASRALQDVRGMTSSGNLDVVMSDVWCDGTESSLEECQTKPPQLYGIYHHCGARWGLGASYVGAVCTNSLPDLQLDIPQLEDSIAVDFQPLWKLTCAADENCLAPSAKNITDMNSIRSLLRLTVNVWNRGTANFLPWQQPGEWDWHQCHEHYHSMAEFAHYDILSSDTFQRVAEGHKVSFCLSDSACESDISPAYQCNETPDRSNQGISIGCSDAYFAWFDCQWIDITDVPSGNYILRVSLNPRHLVAELDVTNNDITCEMSYDGETAVVKSCGIGADRV